MISYPGHPNPIVHEVVRLGWGLVGPQAPDLWPEAVAGKLLLDQQEATAETVEVVLGAFGWLGATRLVGEWFGVTLVLGSDPKADRGPAALGRFLAEALTKAGLACEPGRYVVTVERART